MSKLLLLHLFFSNVAGIGSIIYREFGELNFQVVNATCLMVRWSQPDSSNMDNIMLYQAGKERQAKIDFRPYEYDNTTLLINHDVCINLENVFVQSALQDDQIYFSKKATYSPSDYLQVCFKRIFT